MIEPLQVAAAAPTLINKPSMRLEAACASGGLACSEAVRAIRAGDGCVLAVGVEVQTEVDARCVDICADMSHACV